MPNNKEVIVRNIVEVSDLLKELRGKGYSWSNGICPTSFTPLVNFPYVIAVMPETKTIEWYTTAGVDAITVEDYFTTKDDEEKTLRIKRHDIHYAMADVIKENDEIGKLFEKQPLLILVVGIIIEEIERKIFGEEGEE